MATLIENIQRVGNDFQSIRTALAAKNVIIPNNTPTNQYSNYIASMQTGNLTDIQLWLQYGGLNPSQYNSINAVLVSNDYNTLLNTEKSAAYAAYISEDIANSIKNDTGALLKALICNNSYMFYNSRFNFLDNLEVSLDENEKVTKNNYSLRVQCSSELSVYHYYAYMAFDGSLDADSDTVFFEDRHIWQANGTNQWIQYMYDEPKTIYCAYIYSTRYNAPANVTIQGSNDGEEFEHIITNTLTGEIGYDKYNKVICSTQKQYKYFRFIIGEDIHPGTCSTGEIRIFTLK